MKYRVVFTSIEYDSYLSHNYIRVKGVHRFPTTDERDKMVWIAARAWLSHGDEQARMYDGKFIVEGLDPDDHSERYAAFERRIRSQLTPEAQGVFASANERRHIFLVTFHEIEKEG